MKSISARNIGIITGLIMVAASLVMLYVLKMPEAGTSKYVTYGIYIAGILLALVLYKNSANKEVSFKAFFSEGFKVFVVAVLIMAIFTFVYYKMNPQIIENYVIETNKFNSTDPNKTAAEVIENGNKIKNIFIPMTIAMNTLLYLILGALVTAIGAGFLSQPMLNDNKK
jgi:membrane protease YdiL (CAAX protease family)